MDSARTARRVIWKYQLDVVDEQVLVLPGTRMVRHIDVVDGIPYLWAEVDPTTDTSPMLLHTYGTGHRMFDVDEVHVGSYLLSGGRLVFHVYRVLP